MKPEPFSLLTHRGKALPSPPVSKEQRGAAAVVTALKMACQLWLSREDVSNCHTALAATHSCSTPCNPHCHGAVPQHLEPGLWQCCLCSITSRGTPLAKGCRPLLLSPGPLHLLLPQALQTMTG